MQRRLERNSPREEFMATLARAVANAPMDGTPIVARNDKGEVTHIRWCLQDTLEAHERPYWGRWDNDVRFEPVAWVPTAWTITDIL